MHGGLQALALQQWPTIVPATILALTQVCLQQSQPVCQDSRVTRACAGDGTEALAARALPVRHCREYQPGAGEVM